ncbi:MAG: hypothetical protein GX779_06580 [Clostridia bacterium]|nr:hypothetical protein [Clostridia bacterium]
MEKRILFAFNAVAEKKRRGLFGECASWDTISTISHALLESGFQIWPVNVHTQEQFISFVKKIPKPHLAFVYAEGFLGDPKSLWDGSGPSTLRDILSDFCIPSSHSTSEVMTLCRHKELTYQRLRSFGLAVPLYTVVNPKSFQTVELSENLSFPLFVKPSGGGCSLGIDEFSLVHNMEGLWYKLRRIYEELRETPTIIESYLPGREYTVGVIGNEQKYVLPIIAFPPEAGIRSLWHKRNEKENHWSIIEADDPAFRKFREIAIHTFEALQASDVIRIDLKEDAQGKPHIIDVNGTPSLAGRASLTLMADWLGINQQQLINLIVAQSLARFELEVPPRLQEIIGEPLLKLISYGHEVA